MKYLAHSAKGGCPPQAYAVHVEGVQTLAKRYAQEAGAYAKTDGEQLLNIVDHTSEAHDIGKLEDENQTELLSTQHAQHLPVHHQDAGAALLLERP